MTAAELNLVIESALVQSSSPDRSVTVAQTLRAFDDLRRAVSERLTGTDGLFAGFDDLHLDFPEEGTKQVAVTALVSRLDRKHHIVVYDAFTTQDGHGQPCSGRHIASGHGATLTPKAAWA
ncbi:hypothetical protein [Nocardioides sambongensis]|uniref:hypothetical protein n=1 Tax=Nocardioides sambongensis TaxID=2589074 RepID=UPI00112C4F89|nr:hypothetical protein [Nocardioides sambongensis]